MALDVRLRILSHGGTRLGLGELLGGWFVETASTTYANFDISVLVWVEF